MDSAALQKARGAFFTPQRLSAYIAKWAVRKRSDRVFEPSCGEASFLIAGGERLRSLGARNLFWCEQLQGVEIHKESARAAGDALSAKRLDAKIAVSDFFDVAPQPTFDAVIGNPPYVRYQHHAGSARAKSLEAALAAGVRLSGLASSWAAATVHATRFLKRDGRLGLVLPAELLTVNYAAPVRNFLLKRFSRVRLVMFENLVFPGVLAEVVLLLAEGTGGAKCFEVYQARDIESLASIENAPWRDYEPSDGSKWTPALLSADAFSAYQDLATGQKFCSLLDWGETYLGAVTGANDYFSLTRTEVAKLGILEADCIRISPPGSRHLRGLRFTEHAWDALANDGAKCFLFYPATDKPNAAARRLIEAGEAKGVHRAYKCKVRKPWWRVPLVETPDLFLTYMNHDRPRFVANEANADILNSLYGVKLRKGRRALGRELLPIACLNSLTILGSEMVGRAYGGGLLKLEPREADKLPVPTREVLEGAADSLRALKPQLATALRQGQLIDAVQMVDKALFGKKMAAAQLTALWEAREVLCQRRMARSRGVRAYD